MNMEVYGRNFSQNAMKSAMRHMCNRTNSQGVFTKSTLEDFAVRQLGVSERLQSRRRNGQFGPNVYPSDRFADRLIQKMRRQGRVRAIGREGNVTLWSWVPSR